MDRNGPEDHVKLGHILQKERSPSARREVEKILGESISTKDKIRLIQKLDQGQLLDPEKVKSPDAGKNKEEPKTETPTAESPIKDLENILIESAEGTNGVTLATIKKNREFLKRPLVIQGFFTYLFWERASIKKFGLDTRTIVPKGLFRLRLSQIASEGIRRGWKMAGTELVEILTPILDQAWLHLTRSEFNALSALGRFAQSLKVFAIPNEGVDDNQLVPFFKDVERDYLVLVRDPSTLESMQRSLETLCKKDLNLKAPCERIWRLWRKLCQGNTALPGLESIILGVNMLRCRRYLGFNDLMASGVGPTMSSQFYEGPPELQGKINTWILTNEKRLGQLVKHWEETLGINKYLPAQGRDDWHLLEVFYNYSEGTGRQIFVKDMESPPQFFSGFINKILDTFRGLLAEEVTILPRRKVRIFQSLMFSHELDKLTLCADRINKISYMAAHFSRKHYFDLKNKQKTPTGYDASMMQVFEETLTILVAIARKVMDILKTCSSLPSLGDDTALGAAVFQGHPSPIPYFSEILTEAGPLTGKSLQYALENLVSLCLITSFAFHENLVMGIIHSQEQWERDIRSILSVIERVGTSEVNQYFRQKYHL